MPHRRFCFAPAATATILVIMLLPIDAANTTTSSSTSAAPTTTDAPTSSSTPTTTAAPTAALTTAQPTASSATTLQPTESSSPTPQPATSSSNTLPPTTSASTNLTNLPPTSSSSTTLPPTTSSSTNLPPTTSSTTTLLSTTSSNTTTLPNNTSFTTTKHPTTSSSATAALTTSLLQTTTGPMILENTTIPVTTPAPPPPGVEVLTAGQPVLLSNRTLTADGTFVLVLGSSQTAVSVSFPGWYVFPAGMTVALKNLTIESANWTALYGDPASTVSDLVEIEFGGVTLGGNSTGPPFTLSMFADRLAAGARRDLLQNPQQYRINNLASPTQACNCTTMTAGPFSCDFSGSGTFAVVKETDMACPNVIVIDTTPPPRPRPYISGGVVYLTCGKPFTQKDWLNVSRTPGFAFVFSCGDSRTDPQVKFDRTFLFRQDWWFSITQIEWSNFRFPDTWEADRMVSDILLFNQSSDESIMLATVRASVTFTFSPIRDPEVIPVEAASDFLDSRRACATAGHEYRVAFEGDGMEGSCKCNPVAACLEDIPCRDDRTGHYALRLQLFSLCNPPPPPPPPPTKYANRTGPVAGGVVAGIVVVCICAWLYYRYQTRWAELEKKRKREARLLPPPPMLKIHLGKTKNRAIPAEAMTGYYRKNPAPKPPSALGKLKAKCFGEKLPEDQPAVDAEVGLNEVKEENVGGDGAQGVEPGGVGGEGADVEQALTRDGVGLGVPAQAEGVLGEAGAKAEGGRTMAVEEVPDYAQEAKPLSAMAGAATLQSDGSAPQGIDLLGDADEGHQERAFADDIMGEGSEDGGRQELVVENLHSVTGSPIASMSGRGGRLHSLPRSSAEDLHSMPLGSVADLASFQASADGGTALASLQSRQLAGTDEANASQLASMASRELASLQPAGTDEANASQAGANASQFASLASQDRQFASLTASQEVSHHCACPNLGCCAETDVGGRRYQAGANASQFASLASQDRQFASLTASQGEEQQRHGDAASAASVGEGSTMDMAELGANPLARKLSQQHGSAADGQPGGSVKAGSVTATQPADSVTAGSVAGSVVAGSKAGSVAGSAARSQRVASVRAGSVVKAGSAAGSVTGSQTVASVKSGSGVDKGQA